MSDLHHYIGDDLSVSATGDLLIASGTEEGQQRVLRRLLTNPGDYIWHLDYGAGLPREVGNTLDTRRLNGLIRSQVFNESVVSRNPDPNIILTAIQGGVSARIQYVDAVTQQQIGLAFDINR